MERDMGAIRRRPETQRPVKIRKVDHSALVVSDLEQTRWFYGDVLGFAELPRPMNFTFGGCWFRGAGFELHFIAASDTTVPAGIPNGGDDAALLGLVPHLAFEVEDLDAMLDYLRGHGIEILSGPIARGDGVVQAYVCDPDGYCLEFLARDHDARLQLEERSALLPTRP
jgi:catechol 2,3-dioxygenase-like lactoylglutathione lyase family enzyme